MLVRVWIQTETRDKLKVLSKSIGIDQYKLLELMLDYIIENDLIDEVIRRVRYEKKAKPKIKQQADIPDYIKKL